MSEYNYKNSTARSKRNRRRNSSKRSKRRKPRETNILYLILSITVPITCCILLFSEVCSLNKQIDSMVQQLETLEQTAANQQEQLQKWQNSVQTMGQAEIVMEQEPKPEVNDLTEGTSGLDVGENVEIDVIQDTVQEYAHTVCLTFDDGPSIYTDDILDILAKYNVKATFFVVGKEDERYRESLQRIAEEGHTIGLHSYSHEYEELYSSVEAFEEDFLKLQDYVYEVTGIKSKVFRFPGGSSNTVSDLPIEDFVAFLDSQDVEYYDWNISSGDGGSILLEADAIVTNVMKNIASKRTAMILMHDSADKPTTVEALPTIIENILAMEDTVILPITEDTRPVQHIEVNK